MISVHPGGGRPEEQFNLGHGDRCKVERSSRHFRVYIYISETQVKHHWSSHCGTVA